MNVNQFVTAAHAETDSLRGQIIQVIREQMKHCDSVIEFGAGHFEMIGALNCPTRLGVEIHPPYIERRICDKDVIPICADATIVAKQLPENSFEGVLMVDFIEHLEKSTALNMLADIERIATKAILVHCPAGQHPQSEDVFGLGGDEYQTHRSQWEAEDFESRGYVVVMIDKFFEEKDGVDPRAIVAVKRLNIE